ncbi:MAG: DUF1501 domain-containing protein [Bdellovibrionota bacterium]
MNRRDFLQLLASASATAALPAWPRLARAAGAIDPATARFFVLLRVSGGWDVTLSIDPKVHANGSSQSDMFIEYAPDKIVDLGGVKVAPAAAPLGKYAGEFSVVNGVIMGTSDQGHSSGLEYVSSGTGDGKSPYIPIELAAATPIGSLGVVFNGMTKTLDRKIMVSSITSVQSFKEMMDLADFENYIAGSTLNEEFARAQKALIEDRVRVLDLIERLKKTKYENDYSEYSAATIAAAFASGTSLHGQIDISVGGNLDTHSNHEGIHLNLLKTAHESIAKVFDVFKNTPVGTSGASLFDRTIFMVVSEFSRTPVLTASKGKDHNPLTNSILLAGGGIKGGQVIGESHLVQASKSKTGGPVHAALPVDFQTWKPARTKLEAESGQYKYITPENVVATIAEAMKVDWTKFKSIPQNTASLSPLIKPGF